ncbi:MAG: hypothetical protein HYR51_10005 [Candidatus Rokubacteria bacterium]|nr:hypothetical protein [Candidatus Rokubacteria bacterium]
MDAVDLVLLGVSAILVVLLWDLVFAGGKWCARLAERSGLVARRVVPRAQRRTRSAAETPHPPRAC